MNGLTCSARLSGKNAVSVRFGSRRQAVKVFASSAGSASKSGSASGDVVGCAWQPNSPETHGLPVGKEYKVVVQGRRLVCADLPNGKYTVASWRSGETARGQKRGEPLCNAEEEKGFAFCTLNEAGDLVCEGITEGEYDLVQGEPSELCKLNDDWSEMSCDSLGPEEVSKEAAEFLAQKKVEEERKKQRI